MSRRVEGHFINKNFTVSWRNPSPVRVNKIGVLAWWQNNIPKAKNPQNDEIWAIFYSKR